MIFNNIKEIKLILGENNTRRFYYLIPLEISTSLLEIFSISIIIPFVIAVSDKKAVLDSEYSSIITNNFESYDDFLLIAAFVMICVSLLSTALSIYSNSKKIFLANKIGQEVSQIQYKKYLLAQYGFHSSVNKTEITKNLISEVTRFTNNVLIASLMMISKGFFLVVIVVFMMIINPLITFSIITSLSLIYLLIYKTLQYKLLTNGKEISKSITHIYSIISESLNGIKETKFYGLENYYLTKFVSNSNTIANRTSSSQTISIVPKSVVEFIVLTLLLLTVMYLNLKGNLVESLPLITFFLYAGYRALPALQQVYNSSVLIKANYESVNQILKFDNLIDNTESVKKLMDSDEIHEVSIKDLNFGYANKAKIFKDLSFKITSPSFVAIVGKSGSGKSTLIDLLLKLNHPESGEILINNNHYTYSDAKSLFAYVPQSIYLADSSIQDNVSLGMVGKPINKESVNYSFKLAGLSEFIQNLPNGVHTSIGENGSLLSGGQRKRLGLARAFYSKKPVLILDEVTSGLDSVTESNILKDLKLLSKEKLVILVTHNLHNLSLFDQVIDLK